MSTVAEKEPLFVRLYLDEDVFKDVALALRLRGFDAVSVHKRGRQGLSDDQQLDYATAENRAIFTFNVADYLRLHSEYRSRTGVHAGIIVSKQLPIGEVIRRLLRLLNRVTATEIYNQLWWLSDR